MSVAAEAPVNMSTHHDPRPHSLDRVQQLAASNVLDAASVKVERAVPVVQRRLMRHEDVDAFRNCRVHRLELVGFFMNAQRMNLFDHGVAQTDRLVPSEHGIVVASSTRIWTSVERA